MYQDPLNQHRAPIPPGQNPDNQESLAGHWQQIVERAGHYWNELTENEISQARGGRRALIEVLQSRYHLSAHEADRRIEDFLTHPQHRGLFERLAAMNGKLNVNQYVSNPAPGPSARDDQPPSVLPPDDEPD